MGQDTLSPPPMDLKSNPSLYRWLQTLYTAFGGTPVGNLSEQIDAINQQIAALQARFQVRNGVGAPATSLGVNGDWYADTTNKHIYVKVSGAWVQIV